MPYQFFFMSAFTFKNNLSLMANICDVISIDIYRSQQEMWTYQDDPPFLKHLHKKFMMFFKSYKITAFLSQSLNFSLIVACCKAVKHAIFCGLKMQFKFVNTNLDRIFFHYILMKIIFLDTNIYNPLMGGFLVGTFLFYFASIK